MNNQLLSPRMTQISRILIGLIFGIIIAAIVELGQKSGILKSDSLREALIATLVFSGCVLLAGIGAMRRISFLLWALISATSLLFIFYHIFHQGRNQEDFLVLKIIWVVPFAFICNELVSSGDQAHQIIAPYVTYFDEAWKRVVQLGLSLAFVGAFWIILTLGGQLLKIIGLDWLNQLIREKFFSIPITCTVFATAVHLTDVNTKLLNNFRNLILSVFSWLLPLIVLVGAIFALSLPFTGLKLLWETKAATASLLSACVILVVLVNAAYQNGEEVKSRILRISIHIATFETLVFAFIAFYSLYLRIDQYGLTNDRILAGVGVIIAIFYGVSYFAVNFIGLKSPEFLPRLKQVNIGMAFVKALVFLAILTPIADPSRLAVNSQVGRLLAGKITPDKFDYRYLRAQSGLYGISALDKLAQNSNAQIAQFAQKAIDIVKEENNSTEEKIVFADYPNPKNFNIVKGAPQLPASFLKQKNEVDYSPRPSCVAHASVKNKCNVAILDLNDDKIDEIFIADETQFYLYFDVKGKWHSIHIYPISELEQIAQSMAAGKVEIVKPKWNSLKIGDETIQIPAGATEAIETESR